jgi:AAA domain
MMDVILANKLVRAIPPGAYLLLVGDVGQLPSVGAGEVLRDLLAASTIPRVRLTQIFRQARQSGIVVNAHRINHGQPPQLAGFSDFYWFTCDPPGGLRPAPGAGDRQTCRGHRRPPHPDQIRARPGPRRPGAHLGAPRPRRRGEPQHAAATSPHPAPRPGARKVVRRAGAPRRGQAHRPPSCPLLASRSTMGRIAVSVWTMCCSESVTCCSSLLSVRWLRRAWLSMTRWALASSSALAACLRSSMAAGTRSCRWPYASRGRPVMLGGRGLRWRPCLAGRTRSCPARS